MMLVRYTRLNIQGYVSLTEDSRLWRLVCFELLLLLLVRTNDGLSTLSVVCGVHKMVAPFRLRIRSDTFPHPR